MGDTRWLVEMVLPAGTFEVRSVSTDRTDEQWNADIHASVADLLAWKSPAPAETSPMAQQQQTAPVPRRLLMAHAAAPDRAMKIASDLRAIFPKPALPWSQGIRKAFDAYLEDAMK